MEQQESFGERLRRLREAAGFSQETLAERAGLSANAISALERGERRRPYPDTVRRIADALGLDNDHREAFAAIARQRASSPVPFPRAGVTRRALSIPPERDVLIGRDNEIDVLGRLLSNPETHLLTLTGPGGIGKTRLAIRLAHLLGDAFPDGIVWVDLAPLADASLVLPAISNALGIKASSGEGDAASIRSALADRGVLVILDNAEHVRDAAPDLADIIPASARLRLLATSRAPLNIRGEQEYEVPPLPLPVTGHLPSVEAVTTASSVQLFLRSVQHKQPDFAIDPGNAQEIAGICRRLDGVPLALELAAAKVPLLGVNGLAERLEAALPLLTGGKRDVPSRQQTMEATIRWSYDLLTPAEQCLFRMLSVFSGGWTLESAEEVVSLAGTGEMTVMDGMAGLIDHSLVRRTNPANSRARYGMLGTFREFGRVRLRDAGEEETVVAAHLQWTLQLARTAEPHLTGPAQDYWLDQLASERDNIRAALASSVPGTERQRLELASSIWRFWYIRGTFAEGRAFLEQCLESPGDADDITLANALNGAGILAQESGQFVRAESLYARALALRRAAGDARGVVSTLSNLGLLADHRGNYDAAIGHYEECLEICRDIDHPLGIGNALNNLGLVYRDLGDVSRARESHEESLRILRRIGDHRGSANAVNNLGNIALDTDNLVLAEQLHRESLEIRRRLDDRPGIAMSLKNLGTVARRRGDPASAATLYRESLVIRQELDDVLGSIPTLGDVAALADAVDRHEVAVRLVSAARTIRQRLGAPPPPAVRLLHEDVIRRAEDSLDPDVFHAAVQAGETMDGGQGLSDALTFLDQFPCSPGGLES